MSKTKDSLVELREATLLKSISFQEQSLQASLHVSASFFREYLVPRNIKGATVRCQLRCSSL
jgi:hypothetical protein